MSNTPSSALTRKHKWGYGLGDAGACMTFTIISMYATRYYVNVLKIDTNAMALILLIWNIWDAVNDPLMGALMDKMFAKNRNPKGKFRPWLLRATPLVAISAVIFFVVPTFFEGITLMVVLFFAKILYEGCYTMFNIPMGSLLSAMAKNDVERAQLSSARGFGSTVSSIVPVMICPMILKHFGDTPTAFAICAVLFAGIGFVMCLLHYKWTEERVDASQITSDAGDSVKITDILVVFRKNRAFLALCIHSLCFMTQSAVFTALGSYMYSDVLGDIGLMTIATAASMPFSFLFLGIAPKLAKKMGLNKMVRTALVLSIAMYLVLFGMHMVMDVNPYFHMIWSAIANSLAMVSTQQQYGMVGEAIDYNEYLTGKRTEGSIYGTFSLSRRVGTTIGNSLGVFLLGVIGYNADLAVQTPATLMGITSLCVLLPAIFLVGSWFAFRFVWNINDDVRAKMAASKAAK